MSKKRVLAFGSFDLVHKGHEHYLREAKKLGTDLVIVIARDETIETIKGKPPRHNEEQRKKDVEALGIADSVVLGNSLKNSNKFKIVEDYRPDVIALGYDQKENAETIKQRANLLGWKLDVVRINSFEPENYKSSLLKKK
ncbi:MAG: adenylyltransferase/cytidyltransferase family protein [Candidatus Diapherotrites archaeon]